MDKSLLWYVQQLARALLWQRVPVGSWVGTLASSSLYLLPSGCGAFLSVSVATRTH